jgi:hypothetical protein
MTSDPYQYAAAAAVLLGAVNAFLVWRQMRRRRSSIAHPMAPPPTDPVVDEARFKRFMGGDTYGGGSTVVPVERELTALAELVGRGEPVSLFDPETRQQTTVASRAAFDAWVKRWFPELRLRP